MCESESIHFIYVLKKDDYLPHQSVPQLYFVGNNPDACNIANKSVASILFSFNFDEGA